MTSLFTDRQERVRFLKFSIVGTIGAFVDFLVMNLLTRWLGFSLTLAGTLSFICAVTSNFIWNRYWTYPDSRSKKVTRQLGMFFVVNVAGIAIRFPILHFIEPPLNNMFHNFGFPHDTPDLIAKNLTLAIAIGMVLLWNYYINRYWTYNDVDKVMK
jgi:putative flippase GtrA